MVGVTAYGQINCDGERGIRKEAGAPLKTKVDILVKLTDPALKPIFEQNFDFIDRFVNSKAFTVGTDVVEPKWRAVR